MKRIILLLTIGVFSYQSKAQTLYTEVLNENNASATINDEGLMFSNINTSTSGYEIPKGSGKKTIFGMSPWIGAHDVNGQMYLSSNTYGESNFNSGPIANFAEYGNAPYETLYQDAIWSVTRQEIDDHLTNYSNPGYVAPNSILNWPGNGDTTLGVSHYLAAFVDQDNDGLYEPYDGDYPDVRGDKATLVILNDESVVPQGQLWLGMKLELHLLFYQFNSNDYLNNTTFMNVKAFNRSTVGYYNYRQTFFTDYDLGNFHDDFVGCDTNANVGYAYNGDAFDEDVQGALGYGVNPPCQGLVVLSHDMHSFGAFSNFTSYPYSDPTNQIGQWNFMNAKFSNGDPWVWGGQGYVGSPGATLIPTNFMFSGNPNVIDSTSWSEQGAGSIPSDRRAILTIAEGEFMPGDVICSDYAWVFDDSDNALTNVNNVIDIAHELQDWYALNDGSFGCHRHEVLNVNSPALVAFEVYPNPSKGQFNVVLPEPYDNVQLDVLDIMGRIVVHKEMTNTQEFKVDMTTRPGTYFVRTTIHGVSNVQKIVVE